MRGMAQNNSRSKDCRLQHDACPFSAHSSPQQGTTLKALTERVGNLGGPGGLALLGLNLQVLRRLNGDRGAAGVAKVRGGLRGKGLQGGGQVGDRVVCGTCSRAAGDARMPAGCRCSKRGAVQLGQNTNIVSKLQTYTSAACCTRLGGTAACAPPQ